MIYPLAVLCSVIGLSIVGLYQKRWIHLHSAIILGWLGPLPGAVLGLLIPKHGGFAADSFFAWQNLVLAVVMFGPYCFFIGLSGSWLIIKFTQPPAPKWAQPLAIMGVSAFASVPLILLEGSAVSGLGLDAAISSAFWCAVLLVFRRRFFQ